VTTSNHTETLRTVEYRSTWQESDRVFAGVDDVAVVEKVSILGAYERNYDSRIDLVLRGVRAHTEDTVFRLQPDLGTRLQETGGQNRHTNTQVAVHAVLQLLGGSSSDLLPSKTCCVLDFRLLVGSLAAVLLFLSKHDYFNLLVDTGGYDSVNVDSGQVDFHRVDLADFNNVFGLDTKLAVALGMLYGNETYLDNGKFGGLSHECTERSGGVSRTTIRN
jgi:hypothetical protein